MKKITDALRALALEPGSRFTVRMDSLLSWCCTFVKFFFLLPRCSLLCFLCVRFIRLLSVVVLIVLLFRFFFCFSWFFLRLCLWIRKLFHYFSFSVVFFYFLSFLLFSTLCVILYVLLVWCCCFFFLCSFLVFLCFILFLICFHMLCSYQ